jgi:hypothetical protein
MQSENLVSPKTSEESNMIRLFEIGRTWDHIGSGGRAQQIGRIIIGYMRTQYWYDMSQYVMSAYVSSPYNMALYGTYLPLYVNVRFFHERAGVFKIPLP